MMSKRRFGRVRQLPSGRWQARYPGPDGTDRPAPETFATKTDAEVWLTLKEAEILQGDWTNPDDGKVLLAQYAATWIGERGLRPKTIELYRYLLAKHVAPRLGQLPIADVKAGHVRRWRKELLDANVSAVTSYSPARQARHCGAGTSGSESGCLRSRRPKSRPCTFTIFATPETT